jgi:hypothetical protein
MRKQYGNISNRKGSDNFIPAASCGGFQCLENDKKGKIWKSFDDVKRHLLLINNEKRKIIPYPYNNCRIIEYKLESVCDYSCDMLL